jgi:hypothetical protein
MSVSVTFNGVAYSIPEDGETGWSALTDYLVALSSASVATALKASVRTITVSPATAQATDCVLLCDVGSSVINLPTGVRGQFYAVYDKYGNAKTSNLTINTAAGDTFQDGGTTTYTIATNYGGVLIQYSDTANRWITIAEIRDLYVQLPRIRNDANNPSFLPAAVEPLDSNFFLASNLSVCSANFTGSQSIDVVLTVDGNAIRMITDYKRNTFTIISDAANLFLESDSGTGIFVSKAINNDSISFKSRMGTAVPVEIRAMTNQLTNITGWL